MTLLPSSIGIPLPSICLSTQIPKQVPFVCPIRYKISPIRWGQRKKIVGKLGKVEFQEKQNMETEFKISGIRWGQRKKIVGKLGNEEFHAAIFHDQQYEAMKNKPDIAAWTSAIGTIIGTMIAGATLVYQVIKDNQKKKK